MSIGSPLSALQSAWHASVGPIGQTVGVGIDLVEVEPLRQLVESGGSAFLDAAWTAREQRDTNSQPEGLAGKWAAKEAVMKALQHGIGDLEPLDVEIVSTPQGAPAVQLRRAARAIARKRRIAAWHVSVTHEGGWAAAIAIASQRHVHLTDAAVTTEGGSHSG
jgi:holo-[acyl-carrier protein] synthase